MEILTSMTFWIVVVAIIVILAIIGYVAEGTILANKKNENKENDKNEKKDDSAWTTNIDEKEEKQETVYNTAEKSWMDMPDSLQNKKVEEDSSISSLDNGQVTPVSSEQINVSSNENIITETQPVTQNLEQNSTVSLESNPIAGNKNATEPTIENQTTSSLEPNAMDFMAMPENQANILNNPQPEVINQGINNEDATINSNNSQSQEINPNTENKNKETETLNIWTN